VVFVVLFVAHVKKFASAATSDTWCVQMIGATKLVAMIFLE
jgi:hypothetical protein